MLAFFIVSTTLFSILSIVFTIALALWTYEDAKVKSDQSPLLWVLFSVLVFPIGTIVYLVAGRTNKDVEPPRKYKSFLIVSGILYAILTVLFTVSIIGFTVSAMDSGVGSTRIGNFSASWSRVQNDEWTFTARTANGWERRSPVLSAEQLANFHVLSDSGDGIILHLEQGNTQEIIDLSGFHDQQINMSAFQAGRVNVTLRFDRAQDVDVRISWWA
ncbi:MAG: hypothetical protein FWC89_03225 [Defluviitaleaceae bacterium]|nr:hypothetical protein [Defluviitaleaceae bacterium]